MISPEEKKFHQNLKKEKIIVDDFARLQNSNSKKFVQETQFPKINLKLQPEIIFSIIKKTNKQSNNQIARYNLLQKINTLNGFVK